MYGLKIVKVMAFEEKKQVTKFVERLWKCNTKVLRHTLWILRDCTFNCMN